MEYKIEAKSTSKNNASISIKKKEISFGITSESQLISPNPAELFLGAFAACVLKNIERFSNLMKFTYSRTNIKVRARRTNSPPMMADIEYELIIYSNDSSLNVNLLKKNIEKYGTIYNTVKRMCKITSSIRVLKVNGESNI